MSRHKHHYSKVFYNYNFDIGIDRDFDHQKVWNDREQQTKHVQQMKQLDRIFQGVIKERIFGTILAQRHRLSKQECFKLDRVNKTINGKFRKSVAKSIGSRLNDQRTIIEPLNSMHRTIDMEKINCLTARKRGLEPLGVRTCRNEYQGKKQSISATMDRSVTLQLSKVATHHNHQTSTPSQRQKSPNLPSNQKISLNRSKTDIKTTPSPCNSIPSKKLSKQSSIILLKQMNLDNNELFEEKFKKLSAVQGVFLEDIKITKQAIINRTKDVVNPRLLQYFFYFFGFPTTGAMTFRQYKKGIEKAFNSPLNLIYFFTFRVLDQSGNGFLTISDLFRFLQNYPQTSYIQKQLFNIRKRINEVGQQLMKVDEERRSIKPTLEEILVVNHKLRADQVMELLRQSIKQEVSRGAGQVKLTCYSQSVMALEHDVGFRLKQYELENQKSESQAMNAKNNQKDNFIFNQDGLRFSQFSDIFNGRRPKIFCLLVNILTGLKNEVYE